MKREKVWRRRQKGESFTGFVYLVDLKSEATMSPKGFDSISILCLKLFSLCNKDNNDSDNPME